MIIAKKGSAHSLRQSDKVAPVAAGVTVTAGQIVSFTSTGTITLGADSDKLAGFAINNSTDTDAIGAGKTDPATGVVAPLVGVYLLDGNSVIETDQVVETITLANVGAPIYASQLVPGKLTLTAPGTKPLQVGRIEGIRSVPNTVIGSSGYGYGTVTMVGIKVVAA